MDASLLSSALNGGGNSAQPLVPASSSVDLSEVDFEWLSRLSPNDSGKLRRAIEQLEREGGFPELTAAAKEKLRQLDPKRWVIREEEGCSRCNERERDVNADSCCYISSLSLFLFSSIDATVFLLCFLVPPLLSKPKQYLI